MKAKKSIGVFMIGTVSVVFSIIYLMSNVGYYEYSNQNKKIYTEEQIKEFEQDIENGVEIDIKNYIDIEGTEVREQLSLKISKFIGGISKYCIKEIFKLLNKVVEI